MVDSIYEGNSPYLFISYSHKDRNEMESVKRILDENKIRYWYDNGLHSGDDWNMKIATHLEKASTCLILLSKNSSESEYVKNELNFASNHRIPIHILLLHEFVLPIDIEMMTGRIQMIKMEGNYSKEFVKSLPNEIFSDSNYEEVHKTHPLFVVDKLHSDRQGTKVYDGIHSRLKYKCTIVEDILHSDQIEDANQLMIPVCSIKHPIFPFIYDIEIENQKMFTYQEYCGGQFLDEFLKSYEIDQETIIRWIQNLIEGIDCLYAIGFAFRDLARGSLIVDQNNDLRLFRLNNPYYGIVRLSHETKQYYFDNSVQEISILLAQLCLGKVPVMPIQFIETERFDSKFLTKINLIIQKCTKEDGRSQYNTFSKILEDLNQQNLKIKDKLFLKKRKKKLNDYEEITTNNQFTSIKEFDPDDTMELPIIDSDSEYKISVLICSTGKTYNFNKDEILVGRGNMCDVIWNQPLLSRIHLKIIYKDEYTYIVQDLKASNGCTIDGKRIPTGSSVEVAKGSSIKVADFEMKLL